MSALGSSDGSAEPDCFTFASLDAFSTSYSEVAWDPLARTAMIQTVISISGGESTYIDRLIITPDDFGVEIPLVADDIDPDMGGSGQYSSFASDSVSATISRAILAGDVRTL